MTVQETPSIREMPDRTAILILLTNFPPMDNIQYYLR